ncbi:hypothetical protein BH09BAC4_BH09BAC4_23430 [soil metagenome]
MKEIIVLVLGITSLATTPAVAQIPENESLRLGTPSWPLTISAQFHSLSLPFRDVRTAFPNVGVGLGTEFNYKRRGNLIQTMQVGYYHNRYAGDGLFVSTQAGYRPHVGSVFAEIKAGVGWNYTFHPNTVVELREGQWQASEHTGKGLLMVPLGISIGYARPGAVVAPFIGYQVFLLAEYNPSVPAVPNQLLQVGMHIHVKH